jgi:long-chain acyl-CoA synthetase
MTYTTPVQNLLKQSKNNPDKVYLYQPIERQWQKFTWAEVEHQARSIAKGLQSRVYEKGSRIGILSKKLCSLDYQ